MNTELIGTTLDVLGNVFIAIVVLNVHARIARERTIDAKVIGAMKKEKFLVIIGIVSVLLGYIIRLPFF